MSKFFLRFIGRCFASLIVLYLLDRFVPGVKVMIFPGSNFFGYPLTEKWQVFLILALTLGFINSFIKPIIDFITFPLKFLTFGLFGFIVNLFLLKVLDWCFVEFSIVGFLPLILSALILIFVNGLLGIE